MNAITAAAELARKFEGLYLRPYLCPAGIPTIGYGATYYEDGTHVRLTDAPITKDRAEALLEHMLLTVYAPAVSRLCPAADTPGRAGALIDFAYNLGVGNLSSSGLRRRVNAGQWDEAKLELLKWTRGGGRVLPGLVKRRAAEAEMMTIGDSQ